MAHNRNSHESRVGLNTQQPRSSLEMTMKDSSMHNIGGSVFSHNSSMAFTTDRSSTINAPYGTFNSVHGNQTNITNQNIGPKIFYWPRESIASGAFYDSASSSSSPCFPGTREEITALISDWISNPNGRLLGWLCGHAGSGKSAIAQTISRRCADAGQLAATFFCSRVNADHGRKLVSTIAFQLTRSFPSLEDSIHAVIEGDPQIFDRVISVQFQRLIINPLIQNRGTLRRLVVVIDALDECDEKSAAEIAPLISNAAENRDIPVQFFITSRPAFHIEVPFTRNNFVIKSFMLHGFGVCDDIRLFLTSRFQEIYERHPAMRDVAQPWPSDGQIDQLVEMSDLFIFASSVIRFVDDRSNSPDDQLKAVLSDERWLPEDDELDKLYHQILSPPRVKEGDKEHLRLILGTIIMLQKPLSLPAIGILLRAHMSVGRLRALMDPLRCLIQIPDKKEERQGKPVTTFHKSFPDFLTDRSRSARDYWIDPSVFGASLTASCLDLLSDSEFLELRDRESNSIALDYARTHYLGLLKEGAVNDLFLECAGLIALNTVMLVITFPCSVAYHHYVTTNHEWFWRLLLRSAITVYCFFALSIPALIIEFTYPIRFTRTQYCLHAFIGLIFTSVWAVNGKSGCHLPPPTCRETYDYFFCGPGSLYAIVHPIASGAIVDQIIRTVFGLDSGMACEVSGSSLGASVMRAVTFGAIFDLVFQVIMVVAKQVIGFPYVPLTVVAVWLMGSAVGRAMGVVIVASADTNVVFWIILVIIIGFTSILCIPLVPSDIPITDNDHHLCFFLHQRHCRWIKACYRLALQRRQITISPAAPLQYAIFVVKFYVMILKPTHVLAPTCQERLYCDWCRETNFEDGNRLKKWILRTVNGL